MKDDIENTPQKSGRSIPMYHAFILQNIMSVKQNTFILLDTQSSVASPDGFSSFHCNRPRTQRNDWSVPFYTTSHYIRSVVYRSVVSAVICHRFILSAGNL